MPKNKVFYECKSCDFNTSNKFNYTKHLSTLKHQFTRNETEKARNETEKMPHWECHICYSSFNDRTTLWRHKKKCIAENENEEMKQIEDQTEKIENQHISSSINTDIVLNLFKQNKELQDFLMEQNKILVDMANKQAQAQIQTHQNQSQQQSQYTITNTTMSHSNNTNSNNKFNLNFFLNETCKDAMNIMDFVNSLKLQLSDLENVGDVGYIEGISSIILKNLKELDVSKRPMHCSDLKREIIYVKDEDKWEKEDSQNKRLKKAIKYVANKNFQLIPEWKKKYPDCVYSDSKSSDQYNRLLIESVGGKFDTDINENRIIKKIAKEVFIDKN
jgi:hypothetical protein